eukprot:TRINITY_DN7883_c0_g1_i3.p1 TRINITY_DN7883_c0_g1~~TRINITY_DN7883_c0_g1_i3.p1  ORF type:complete len:145 (-),score=12.85 TRINITY_DN7883_c0_g1_i3:38-472(-)
MNLYLINLCINLYLHIRRYSSNSLILREAQLASDPNDSSLLARIAGAKGKLFDTKLSIIKVGCDFMSAFSASGLCWVLFRSSINEGLITVGSLVSALISIRSILRHQQPIFCLLYTSDAADDTPCVDLGGRRIIKKKKTTEVYT